MGGCVSVGVSVWVWVGVGGGGKGGKTGEGEIAVVPGTLLKTVLSPQHYQALFAF